MLYFFQLNHVIAGHSETLKNNLGGCFVFLFRNGSMIPYFAIDVVQSSTSLDLSSEMERAVRAAGTLTSRGLLLTNRDQSRRLLIDDDSVEFIGQF